MKTKMLHVRFYAEDLEKPTKTIDLQFRGWSAFHRFIDNWHHAGGITQFSYDVFRDDLTEQIYPIVPANYKTFRQITSTLYPR